MKVGVLMGGMSSERDISLISGKEVIENIDKNKYEIVPIEINNDGKWIDEIKNIDFAFLALHGKFGEDGVIQGMLETLNIPYTGCGILSSALCMDKDMCKRIVRMAGLKTADWVMTGSTDVDVDEIKKMGFPVVVKPNRGGSSVATSIVKNESELKSKIEEALKWDKEVMIEKYIKGDEITCCMLNGKMLPVLAIKPHAEFFDYTSKYAEGGSDEVVVKLQPELNKIVEDMAVRCYKALKCSVFSRVDMIIKDGEPYILEVNTLPGMTSGSLFPKSAKAAGISFSGLLDKIINYSLDIRK